MKKQNKVISIFFAILVLLSIVIPANIIATETTSVSINESYVSAVAIKETITGLEPFDNNDNAGNDSSASNNIVRSFDNINYTLEYVTALKSQNAISDAYLCVEFVLPYTKDVATFDMSTMAWIEEASLVEIDGQQILSGKRHLQNTVSNDAIPGAGTLSIGIKVQAAPNQTIIQPTFNLWMEGNDESEAQTITSNEITVSAFPKYNVVLMKNGSWAYLGYFDLENGTGGKFSEDGDLYGRITGYGLGIQLYNESIEKGLKGIELPTGDISFDLTIFEGFTSDSVNEMTQDPNYAPLLWTYHENEQVSIGKNGRKINWVHDAGYMWAGGLPARKGTARHQCYDSGSWSVEQISDYTYRFTISDYKFDYDNWHFPTTNPAQANTSAIHYTQNMGYFSTAHIQILCQFPENVTDITDVYLQPKVSNLQATSTSGQKAIEENFSDNERGDSITLHTEGTLWSGIYFMQNGKDLSYPYYAGNASAFRNKEIILRNNIGRNSDFPVSDADQLFKFDANAFLADPDRETKVYLAKSSSLGTVKTLYAAKPDGTNWINDTELAETKQEELIYFTSLDELEKQGFLCVGILIEIRGSYIEFKGWTSFEIDLPLKISSTANINDVYICVEHLRVWDINNSTSFTMEGKQYPYAIINGYVEGYTIPSAITDPTTYKKSQYNDYGGALISGHTGGWERGNSLLIISYESYIQKNIMDVTQSGETKTSYDMDLNERIVTFGLTAKTITLDTLSTDTTTLYITDKLPKDLTYIENSSIWNNTLIEPVITNNADGTTTLEWILENVPIGTTIEPVIFQCQIGKAGTLEDVVNNQIIVNYAQITGTEDKRQILPNWGNCSETSFSVIKLNAISISKSTSTPFVSVGEDFQFTLKFANNSKNEIKNTKLYDVLPYDEDIRNSDFSGFYKINNIIMNFANAPKTFDDYINGTYELNYTNSLEIQTDDFINISSFSNWNEGTTQTVDSTNKTVTYTELPEDITALLFNMSLQGFEYIEITLNMSPTGDQQEGDVYINDFYQYANGQAEQVHSNQAVVQVYGTLNITKIWNDQNNLHETRPESINISILQNGNIYRVLTFDANDVVSGNNNKWNEIAREIPLNDNDGNPYVYTIMEDEENANLQYYYYPPIYNQDTLTVTNTGVWLELNPNDTEPIFHKITITKTIVNTAGTALTTSDFEKLKLDSTATYYFPITLKQMNRSISKGDTGMIESYQGYTGNVFNGIVTNKSALIFINMEAGKYEISEKSVQYFDFVDFTKINSSNGITLSEENGKYYITISGFTDTSEYIEVSVTNQLKNERIFEDKDDKENLFLSNEINNGMMDPDDPQGH